MTITEFSKLYTEHEQQLFAFAKSLSRCESDAKDLLQDTMIKAYQHRNKLESPSKFKSWTATILHNNFVNTYRKHSRRRKLLNGERAIDGHFFNTSVVGNNGMEVLKEQDILSLSSAVGDQCLEAFFMYFEGYSYQEISENQAVAIGTVKSRIHAARAKMKELTKDAKIAA